MATLFRRMEARTRRLNVMTEDEPRVPADNRTQEHKKRDTSYWDYGWHAQTPSDAFVPVPDRLVVGEPQVMTDDQIEAAHCCTSIGADQDEADSRAMPGCGPVLWLVYCVLALLAVAAGWHFVADWLQGAPL